MKALKAGAVVLALAGTAAGEGLPGGTWKGWEQEDEMTDKIRKGVVSAWSSPKTAMTFPAQDTRAVLGLACDAGGAYLRFTSAPIMANDMNRDGYSVSVLRVRFDDDPVFRATFNQTWGGDQLTTKSSAVRRWILAKNRVRVEVPWYGQGNVIFEFSLAGSSGAYRAVCTERLARERAARERAERERAERAEASEVRGARFRLYLDEPATAGEHIERNGWACPNVETVMLAAGGHYLSVQCNDGMEYLIRNSDEKVVNVRRSGRRL